MQDEGGEGSKAVSRRSRLTLIVLAVLALVIPATAGSALAAVSGSTAAGNIPSPGVQTLSDGTQGKVAGMAIPNVSSQQSPDEVGRLHSDGLNTISLFIWWVQQNPDSNTIEPDYTDGITESDADLELQMAATTNVGMKVILVPIFYCLKCEGGWRGTVAPSNPTLWWQSYQAFIDHYATIAQQHGASTFFVGSEMTSMEHYTSNWQSLIGEVRTRFSGQIGYQENWDVIGQAGFVSAVDIVGVSAYFPLDDAAAPALSDLLADWSDSHASATSGKNWVSKLSALAASSGKPILFGEVGYMSGDHAARQPFLNYFDTTDWQLQSDLYQALLETFENKPWWDGVVWWAWDLSNDSTKDNGRSPRGKTAEQLLRDWYAQGQRPSDPTTPLLYSQPQYSPDDLEVPRSSPTSGGSSSPAAGGTASPAAAGSHTGTAAAPTARGAAHSSTSGHPGTGGSAAAASAASATPAAAAGNTRKGTSSSLSGSRRTTAILASIALVIVILALALIGALRRPDGERATARPGGRAV